MKYEDKTDILAEMNDEAITYDGYEDSLIGYVEQYGRPPIACYDGNKAIESLVKMGMDRDEAMEWFGYNTMGAWVGDSTPCFFYGFQEEDEWSYSTKPKSWWTRTVSGITETLSTFGRWFRRGGSSSSPSE